MQPKKGIMWVKKARNKAETKEKKNKKPKDTS